ncbi:MAG: hypothetical protein ACKOPN_03460, partial [Prochlorococcaceae cyanobacterium]
MTSAAPPTIAVIGAGVAACSLLAALRRGGWGGAITLLESGRRARGRSREGGWRRPSRRGAGPP